MNDFSDTNTAVNLDVGGYLFSLFFDDLAKHRDTFFETILKKEWRQEPDKAVKIERDGRLFRYVMAYLVNGCLPRDALGVITLSSEEILAIREEADFFNLPGLIEECNSLTKSKNDYMEISNHYTIIDHIYIKTNKKIDIDFNTGEGDDRFSLSPLLEALENIPRTTSKSVYPSQEERSFCITDWFMGDRSLILLKSSTMKALNIPELLLAATQSAFGKGIENIVDTVVRDSVELPASFLNADTLASIVKELTPKLHWNKHMAGLELRPYKLVLHHETGHFNAHRNTVRGEGHIGTLVLILNSDYTGGELEIAHAGKTVSVTGAYRWVAMYGDCLHQIKPVTSGTRVSLIFDIYASPEAVLRPSVPLDCLAEKAVLVKEIRNKLEEYEAVTICLEHLYPKHQAAPGYLKGHDATLYALLQEDFDLEIVWAVVNSEYDNDEVYESAVDVKFVDCLQFYSQEHKYDGLKMVFAIPGSLDAHTVLKHSPFLEYTVYVVTGLLVRRKHTAAAVT